MAQPVYVNGIAVEGAATSQTVAAALNWAQTAGNTFVVGVFWRDSTRTISSIADTAGNTYTLKVGPTTRTTGNNLSMATYVCAGIKRQATNVNTVTVTFSASTTVQPCIVVAEYTGTTGATDGTPSGTSGSSTAPSTTGPTTTNAVDTVITIVGHWATATTTAGASYTNRKQSTNALITLSDRAVTSTGTYAGAATLSATVAWGIQTLAIHSGNPQVTSDLASGSGLVATARQSRGGTAPVGAGIALGTASRVLHNSLSAIAAAIYIAPPGPRGITITATPQLLRPLQATIARAVTVGATGKIQDKATASVAASGIPTPVGIALRRTSVLMAVNALVSAVGVKTIASQSASIQGGGALGSISRVIHSAQTAIFAGRGATQQSIINCVLSLVARAQAMHSGTSLISSSASMQPPIVAMLRGSALIAVHAVLLANDTRLGLSGSSITSGSVLLLSARVNHNASSPIATRAAVTATPRGMIVSSAFISRPASLVANSVLSTGGLPSAFLTPRASLVPTGKLQSRATITLQAVASLLATNTAQGGAHVSIAAHGGVVITTRSQGSSSIQTGTQLRAFANQVMHPSVSSQALIHSGTMLSRNAAFVTHRSFCQILAGRKPINAAECDGKITIVANATNAAKSAQVSILAGLSPGTFMEGNIWTSARVSASAKVTYKGQATLAAVASMVATATMSHYQSSISTHATLTVVGSVILSSMRLGIGAAGTIVGRASMTTTGPGRAAIASGGVLVEAGTVQRRATSPILTRVNLLVSGGIKLNVSTLLTPHVVVAANGTQARAVSIVVINSGATMTARIGNMFRGVSQIGAVGTVTVVSGAPRQGVVVLATSGTLTAVQQILKRSTAPIGGKSGVVANSRSIKNNAGVITGRAAVGTAGGRAMHPAALSIHAAIGVLARAINNTTAESVSMVTGSTVAVVGRVVHSAALGIGARSTMVSTVRNMKVAKVTVRTAGSSTVASRTMLSGIAGAGGGMSILAGTDHRSLAISLLTLGRTIGAVGSLKSNATARLNPQGGVVGGSAGKQFAALHIQASLSMLITGSRGLLLSSRVAAGSGVRGEGEANFFGGCKTTVANTSLVGTVTHTNPISTIAQTS